MTAMLKRELAAERERSTQATIWQVPEDLDRFWTQLLAPLPDTSSPKAVSLDT